jgi:hypothetical protein
MAEMGTYGDLLSSSASFARLLEDINQHHQAQKQEQEQKSVSLATQISRISFRNSENGEEEDEEKKSLPTNLETKQEGTVKFGVYRSYLQAGVNVILGLFCILIVFSAQQATSLYSNWWLAEWSNDESDRYRVYKNCTNVLDQTTNRIRLMNDTEWNEHRDQRFYTFCC